MSICVSVSFRVTGQRLLWLSLPERLAYCWCVCVCVCARARVSVWVCDCGQRVLRLSFRGYHFEAIISRLSFRNDPLNHSPAAGACVCVSACACACVRECEEDEIYVLRVYLCVCVCV